MRPISPPFRGRVSHPVYAGALLLTLMLPLGAAQASLLPHGSHQRKTIERLEERYRQAVLTDDVATMRRMLSDDYIGINPSGIIQTKRETLADWKNHVVVIQELTLSDVRVRVYGDTAVLTCRATVIGHDAEGSLNGEFRYTRVYHRERSGRWQIVSFEANRIQKHHR
jgi:ketosteroid isomerase-like protein